MAVYDKKQDRLYIVIQQVIYDEEKKRSVKTISTSLTLYGVTVARIRRAILEAANVL